ncbi:MAG: C40 family peptidase [Treponema sp.]|nr:C40 family peptidase [Treponema sp.]
MRILFGFLLFFSLFPLFSAPLEGGYALAPRASASPEERDQAYINARLRVIEASRKYLGTPYRYGGLSSAGVDCSGFLVLSFRDALGVTLPRSASGIYTWTVRINLDRAQPGDFLFFRTDTTNNITHVGLYLGDRVFIHAASAGSRTGVIYSSLDEQYWANAYAGAGRAFPESTPFSIDNNTSIAGGSSRSNPSGGSSGGGQSRQGAPASPPSNSGGSGNNGRLLIGVGIAPIWNGFLKGGDLIRGVSAQFCLGAETYSFGPKMVFGFEVRAEYDDALGVFRLPLTFSWGPNDQIRIFAGPVFSFGDAAFSTDDGKRYYSGGTSWLGTIGFTAAPFVFKSSSGDFSPYIEAAWQSYFSNNKNFDLSYDFSAGFRFSTGVRWLIHVK